MNAVIMHLISRVKRQHLFFSIIDYLLCIIKTTCCEVSPCMQSESIEFQCSYHFNPLNSLSSPVVLKSCFCFEHERGTFLFQLDLTVMRSLQEMKVVSITDCRQG
jgi:hypothetical protein